MEAFTINETVETQPVELNFFPENVDNVEDNTI